MAYIYYFAEGDRFSQCAGNFLGTCEIPACWRGICTTYEVIDPGPGLGERCIPASTRNQIEDYQPAS
jgi:hypothetical protein